MEAAHTESIVVRERKRRHGAGLIGVTGYSGRHLEAGSVALLIDEARYCVPHPPMLSLPLFDASSLLLSAVPFHTFVERVT